MTSTAETQSFVYTWSAPPIPGESKRLAGFAVATLGAAVVGVAYGVAVLAGTIDGNARYALVLAFMLATIGVIGLESTRNARTFRLAIDRNGMLTAGDRSGHSSVDLRTCHEIGLRLRGGVPSHRWSIEAAGSHGGWHREIASIATYWNQPAPEMAALEDELRRWLTWANGANPTAARPGTGTPDAAVGSARPGQAGVTVSTPDRFEWRPPRGANADRNRRRVRIGFGLVAGAIAVFAAVSEWENGLSAVVFSMFVPVLVLIVGAGVDFAYRRSQQFAIVVDATGLSAMQGAKTKAHAPHGSMTNLSVSSEVHTSSVNGTMRRTTIWSVTGTALGADKDVFKAVIPLHLGTAFGTNDAVVLESELRRRLLRPTPGV